MKSSFVLFFLLLFSFSSKAQQLTIEEPVRYLALGDSYTIGQSVSYSERWPTQLFDSLKALGYSTDTLDYIATTGWRTDNLNVGINSVQPDSNYNMVSLLIGVNNQYQGRPFSQYEDEFPPLLERAIALAGGIKERVFVVSIPDYTYTPFGASASTSTQLDNYNNYAEHICDSIGVNYYYITDISREGLNEPTLVAGDGLHPSEKQYGLWVDRIISSGLVASIEGKLIEQNFLYPNPVSDKLFLETVKKWKIFNLNGGLIVEGFSEEIDVRDFLEGMYIIKVDEKTYRFIKD